MNRKQLVDYLKAVSFPDVKVKVGEKLVPIDHLSFNGQSVVINLENDNSDKE